MRRVQRAGETVEVAPVGRGHDRDRAASTRLAADRPRRRADKHELDPVRLQPAQDCDPTLVEMLEAFRGPRRCRFDAGRTVSEAACRTVSRWRTRVLQGERIGCRADDAHLARTAVAGAGRARRRARPSSRVHGPPPRRRPNARCCSTASRRARTTGERCWSRSSMRGPRRARVRLPALRALREAARAQLAPHSGGHRRGARRPLHRRSRVPRRPRHGDVRRQRAVRPGDRRSPGIRDHRRAAVQREHAAPPRTPDSRAEAAHEQGRTGARAAEQ